RMLASAWTGHAGSIPRRSRPSPGGRPSSPAMAGSRGTCRPPASWSPTARRSTCPGRSTSRCGTAGCAAATPPSAPLPPAPELEDARRRVDRARREHPEALEALAWGPAVVTGHGRLARDLQAAGIVVPYGETLHLPRPIHLALRDGRVRRSHAAQRPAPTGP